MTERTCLACRQRPARYGQHYCLSCSAVDGDEVAAIGAEDDRPARSSSSYAVPLISAGVLVVLAALALITIHLMGGGSVRDLMATW